MEATTGRPLLLDDATPQDVTPDDDTPIDEAVPEADRSEQELPAWPEPAIDIAALDEPPTPDELDQARPVRVTSWLEPPVIPHDVPEADALDQARPVPLDDEDEYDG